MLLTKGAEFQRKARKWKQDTKQMLDTPFEMTKRALVCPELLRQVQGPIDVVRLMVWPRRRLRNINSRR
jgi:hypothetical protein